MKRVGLKRGSTQLKRGSRKLVTFECVSCGSQVERRGRGAGLCRACSSRQNRLKAKPVQRKGKVKTCRCGVEFYVHPSGLQAHCSRACAVAAKRAGRQIRCSVCGAAHDPGPPSQPRTTCGSRACLSEAKSRAKRGQLNPRADALTARRKLWRTSKGRACAKCGRRDVRLDQHHVVYEQEVKRRDGDTYDPRDGLTLCVRCHAAHHQGGAGRVPLTLLTEANIGFAFELLGSYAYDYLGRYYSGTDDRLARLMAERGEPRVGRQ